MVKQIIHLVKEKHFDVHFPQDLIPTIVVQKKFKVVHYFNELVTQILMDDFSSPSQQIIQEIYVELLTKKLVIIILLITLKEVV